MLRKIGIVLACCGALTLLTAGQFAAAADNVTKSEKPKVAGASKGTMAGSEKAKVIQPQSKKIDMKPKLGNRSPWKIPSVKPARRPGKSIERKPRRAARPTAEAIKRGASGKPVSGSKTAQPAKGVGGATPAKPVKAASAKASKLKVKPAVYRMKPAVN